MRILHVVASIADKEGGTSEAVRQMASWVAESGHDVEVATTSTGGSIPDGRISSALECAGVKIRVFASLSERWSFSASLGGYLWRCGREFDVVHVHSVLQFPSIPVWLSNQHTAVPYIVSPHGQLDPWSLSQKAWKKRPYYELFIKRLLSDATAVHVTADAEEAHLRRLHPTAQPSLVPLGTELPTRNELDAARERTANRPAVDGLRVLFLGRLHPKKDLDTVIEGCAKLHAAGGLGELVLAGAGDDDYEAHLKRRVAELNLTDFVDFRGFVSGEAKQDVLTGSDVFVLPSHQENFGLAVVEALAHELPVIVSDQVALCDAVAKADAGLVIPAADAEALNAALVQIIDARRLASARRAARRLAEQRFAREVVTKQMLNLYESAAHRLTTRVA